jgi:hypothetical protein
VPIRKIYVFPHGGWSIFREGRDWPLGCNEDLADVLDELFEDDD